MLLAIPNAFTEYILVFVSREYIYLVIDSKSDEMQF
jgi:hypothetical protein